MKYKVWLVSIAFMMVAAIQGMEKDEDYGMPLIKSQSAGANKEAYEEHFENFEYKKDMNEFLSNLAYEKDQRKQKQINQVISKVVDNKFSNVSFMSKEEHEALKEVAFFLAGLPAYRNKLKQDRMRYQKENAPELIAVVDAMEKMLNRQEVQAKRFILNMIRKYPNKLV